MITDMQKALIITGIGIVLVFVGILILWGIMELLVRLTTKKNTLSGEKTEAAHTPVHTLHAKQAAAAAVAVAISIQTGTFIAAPRSQDNALTPWQSLNRGRAYLQQSNRVK